MPRTYGITNVAAYATAPPVGQPGDEYYNLTDKTLYLSDGTQWTQVKGGGGAGGGPYVPVSPSAPVDPNNPVLAPPVGLLWVDSDDNPKWAPLSFTYNQTIPAPTPASSPYTVTHNLGTTNVQVQLWDASTGLLVMAQVRVLNANQIQITVTQNMPNNINVVVIGLTGTPAPLNPGDTATKLYVDQRTPNLPPPVTVAGPMQSFTDALGDLWIARLGTNGGNWARARAVLLCRCYRAAALNTGASPNGVVIPFDTAYIDPYSMFTAPYITLPFTGNWLCGAVLEIQGTVAADCVGFYLNITGGQAMRSGVTSMSTGISILRQQCTAILQASAGNTLQCAYEYTAANKVVTGGDPGRTGMWAQYMGPN